MISNNSSNSGPPLWALPGKCRLQLRAAVGVAKVERDLSPNFCEQKCSGLLQIPAACSPDLLHCLTFELYSNK